MKPFRFLVGFLFFVQFWAQPAAAQVQWATYLKDTTRIFPAHNYRLFGLTTDSLNNAFICYSKSSADTTLSFVYKWIVFLGHRLYIY